MEPPTDIHECLSYKMRLSERNTTTIAIQNEPQHCQSVEYRHL